MSGKKVMRTPQLKAGSHMHLTSTPSQDSQPSPDILGSKLHYSLHVIDFFCNKSFS